MLIYLWVLADIWRGGLEKRWENRYGRMGEICGHQSFDAQEHDHSFFEVIS